MFATSPIGIAPGATALLLGALLLSGCSIPVVLSHPPEVRPNAGADSAPIDCPSHIWGVLDGVGGAGLGVWTGLGIHRATKAGTPVDRRGAIAQSLTTGLLTAGYGFFSWVGITVATNCRSKRRERDTNAPSNPDLKPPASDHSDSSGERDR